MDHSILRSAYPAKLATYLREAAARTSIKAVTEDLLSAVWRGSLPPKVFTVWLSASHDADVLRDAINQDHSRVIRSAGIRQFGRLFCGPRVNEAWNALGGTPGLLEVLSLIPVDDVRTFCCDVGKGGTIVLERELRKRYADELFKALCHQHFPETNHKTADTRPLFKYYQLLLPACSSELVVRHIESEAASPGYHTLRLLEAHSSVFRDRYFSLLSNSGDDSDSFRMHQELLDGLSTDTPAREDPRISTSMLFTIRLLQRLSQGTTSKKIPSHTFEVRMVTPLLRKLTRRKCKPEVMQEVVRMIVLCAKKHYPEGCQFLSETAKGSALWCIVTRWVRYPDQLETSLVELLGALPANSSLQGQRFVDLLESVPMAMRWSLLALLMRNSPGTQVDLASDVDLQRFNKQWPVSLLLAIPSSHARQLLERLIKLKPDGKFVGWYQSRGDCGFLPLHHDDDPTCLLILLSRDHPDGLDKAKLAIEESRKEAATAREQSARVSWVKRALDYAVASGSLNVYHQILLWARRFNKDQNTAREIYSNASLHTAEALDLLCGYPEECDITNITIEDVRSNVTLGNQICRELLISACTAQKEPGFHQVHWQPILNLFEAVTRLRLRRVDQLQDSLSLSDEELYQLVWKDTLDTCLTLERCGLEEEQTQLGFNYAGGPLRRGHNRSSDLSQPRPAALKFMDDLGKERNSLWERYRARNIPNTVTLSAPYPRGLAIQHIFPLDATNWREGFDLPYLRQRAEAVVFVDPLSALEFPSKDKETRRTVARFVENYETALRLYVCAYPIREQQALVAWKHATGPLSLPRMSSGEAFVFWKGIFTTALRDMRVSGPWSHSYLAKIPDTKLPAADDVDTGQPIEWNPDPEAALYEVEARDLEVAILDHMLGYGNSPFDKIDSSSTELSQTTESQAALLLWERYSVPQVKPDTQEALIAAGLLHLNGKRCDSQRLLVTPFPSLDEVRFTALLLDDEFLDRKELDDTGTLITCLQKLNEAIPPTLLLQLVSAMFTELEAREKDAKLAHDTFAMLKLLSKSDRPELALDMIVELILNRPDDSTWHRTLFTAAFFKALPAQKAKTFLERVAQSIQMRIHGRPARTTGTGNSPKVARLPAVKVTTIKMLAQLASRASFVDEATSVGILQGLMVNASHLDVRVAVVQSLIHVFAGSTERNVKDIILKVLEVHAVPIAGSLNERIQIMESDWAKAESTYEDIPEVYMESEHESLGPILSLLVEAASKRGNMSTDDQKELTVRLLLPALNLSAQVNQRWMGLYLKHLKVPELGLPMLPVKPRFLSEMFEHPSYLPTWAAQSWLAMFTIVKTPTPAIAQLNTRIVEDVALRDSNAGKHWLSVWRQLYITGTMDVGILTQLLKQEWQTMTPDGIDLVQIQDLVLRQADVLIEMADEEFADWKSFTQGLQLQYTSRQKELMWLVRCGPVVKTFVDHVNDMRTPTWQEDPFRSPKVLPGTLELRVWLLLHSHLSCSDRDSHLPILANEISDLIVNIAHSSTLYEPPYNVLKSVLTGHKALPRDDVFALVFELGNVSFLRDRDVHLADLLRVKLAAALLLSDTSTLLRSKTEVSQLLEDWSSCRVEEIRMLGLVTSRDVRQRCGNRMTWEKRMGGTTCDGRETVSHNIRRP